MRSIYNPGGLPVTWVVGREDHATSDVGGECHNEIDATECSNTYVPPQTGLT